MSHFSVLVTGDDVEATLQPYHEFECTGTDDQYVEDVSRTEEARKEYESDSSDDKPDFAAWAADYYGVPIIGIDTKRGEDHKYGYIVVHNGEVHGIVLRHDTEYA